MLEKLLAFLEVNDFVKAEWDGELTMFDEKGEPFGAQEFRGETRELWDSLEEGLDGCPGFTLRLE